MEQHIKMMLQFLKVIKNAITFLMENMKLKLKILERIYLIKMVC